MTEGAACGHDVEQCVQRCGAFSIRDSASVHDVVNKGIRFASGGHSNELAPRYDLIPFCATHREAIRMAEGAKDHGDCNYQRAAGDETFFQDRLNHAIGHLLKYADGDRSDDHFGAARANLGILIWLEERRR
jgi:hypothetical protein